MKTRNRFGGTLTALMLALVLAGCATAPADMPQGGATVPAAYKHGNGAATALPSAPNPATVNAQWWRGFGDATLDGLVERATAGNPDIAVAAARLAQSRALLGQVRSAQAVQIDASAGVERGRAGQGSPTQSLGNLGLGASFELDLFGRLSGNSRAAGLDAQSRTALLAAAQVAVQTDVVQTYLTLRATEREQRLVAETASAYRETLVLTERRFAAGDIAELDVARVRSELSATEAEAEAIGRQRALLENALATLSGVAPAQLALASSAAESPALVLPAVPAGLPSELLRRRADVLAAEFDVQAAQQRLGVARSAWFPSLTLTAAGGLASSDLSELLTRGARAWGLGALLSLPILDGGRREAGVAQAQGVADEVQARYQRSVLGALRDVEDQLVSLQTLRSQQAFQSRAVEAATRATELSATRWRNGLVSQLELLDAQRTELRNRRAALQVQTAQQQATVGLVRALGGGWQRTQG